MDTLRTPAFRVALFLEVDCIKRVLCWDPMTYYPHTGEFEGLDPDLELAMGKLSVQDKEDGSNTCDLLEQLPPVPNRIPTPSRTEPHEKHKKPQLS